MLSRQETKIISRCARKYRAKEVFLFGSSLEAGKKGARDIDLGVAGVPDREFFRFYGELTMALPRPVDLVRLTGRRDHFVRRIRQEGRRIYGA